MAQLFTNNAVSNLASGISSGALSLTVQSGHGSRFPSPGGGDYFMLTLFQRSGGTEINHEVVKCTARTGDVLTIVRAQENTTAKAFNNTDPCELRFTSGGIDLLRDAANLNTGTLAVARLPAFTGGDVTSSAGSVNLQIAADVVGFPEMANLTGPVWIGKQTGSGDPEALSVATSRSMLGLQSAAYALTTDFASSSHNHAGVYQPLDGDLTAIAALTSSGFLKRTGTDTWSLDGNSYALASHNHDGVYSPVGHNHDGVYQPIDADLTSIAGLGYTATAFLKKTAANTWALDTNTYSLSSHNHDGTYSPVGHNHSGVYADATHYHTVTLSGVVTSGATSITGTISTAFAANPSFSGSVTASSYLSATAYYPTGSPYSFSGNGSNLTASGSLHVVNGTTSLGVYAGDSAWNASYVHSHAALIGGSTESGIRLYAVSNMASSPYLWAYAVKNTGSPQPIGSGEYLFQLQATGSYDTGGNTRGFTNLYGIQATEQWGAGSGLNHVFATVANGLNYSRATQILGPGTLRIQYYADVANRGVLYLGSGDNYLYFDGTNTVHNGGFFHTQGGGFIAEGSGTRLEIGSKTDAGGGNTPYIDFNMGGQNDYDCRILGIGQSIGTSGQGGMYLYGATFTFVNNPTTAPGARIYLEQSGYTGLRGFSHQSIGANTAVQVTSAAANGLLVFRSTSHGGVAAVLHESGGWPTTERVKIIMQSAGVNGEIYTTTDPGNNSSKVYLYDSGGALYAKNCFSTTGNLSAACVFGGGV